MGQGDLHYHFIAASCMDDVCTAHHFQALLLVLLTSGPIVYLARLDTLIAPTRPNLLLNQFVSISAIVTIAKIVMVKFE